MVFMMAASHNEDRILTKRPERMAMLLQTKLRYAAKASHIIWGVSVEDRKFGLPRIPALRDSGATKTFLSIEPLLEDLGELDLTGISWVIAGGESGSGARPMDEAWVISIRDQCLNAGVPFFFKQWGGVRKHITGRMLDGRTYDEFPAITTGPQPSRQRRRELLDAISVK